MFGRDIDKFFEEMMYRNSPQRSHFYDTIGGRYIEVIDGEKIEYEYEDGIWKNVEDESTEPNIVHDVTETEDGYSYLVDLSAELPDGLDVDTVEYNHGIAEISFTDE